MVFRRVFSCSKFVHMSKSKVVFRLFSVLKRAGNGGLHGFRTSGLCGHRGRRSIGDIHRARVARARVLRWSTGIPIKRRSPRTPASPFSALTTFGSRSTGLPRMRRKSESSPTCSATVASSCSVLAIFSMASEPGKTNLTGRTSARRCPTLWRAISQARCRTEP